MVIGPVNIRKIQYIAMENNMKNCIFCIIHVFRIFIVNLLLNTVNCNQVYSVPVSFV